jgi:tetratricopeptide (TPR) repeat protein
MRRYLFGPVTADYADQHLLDLRQSGECLPFNSSGDAGLAVGFDDTWADVCARLPEGWRPDFLALRLDYTTIPEGLWSAPVPILGLAGDWNLVWHYYRHCLPRCDLVLTDSVGVQVLTCAGLAHVRQANIFGPGLAYREAPMPQGQRDIDLLFVANFHPEVQRERMPWLARLAALADRRRVMLASGIYGAAYRAMLARSKIAFNRSIRGECNQRAFEAPAMGCLLMQEAGNPEVPRYLEPGKEYVAYTDDDFEALVEHYLTHEEERARIAAAGRQRALQCGFRALWNQALDRLEPEWEILQEWAQQRTPPWPQTMLHGRVWQALCTAHDRDPRLVSDLQAALATRPDDAALHHALGLASALEAGRDARARAGRAAPHFQCAVVLAGDNPLFALNLAEAMAALGEGTRAVAAAQRTLALLDRRLDLSPQALAAVHFPFTYDAFRVEWERAAWANAGGPRVEALAKRLLLRWRLHVLLGDLTGELVHYHEAALARPDLPGSRAALGCALGRAKRPLEAVPHLDFAVAANPLDRRAAQALYQALTDAGDADTARQLVAHRRLLHRAAPGVVPAEPWFAAEAGPGSATVVSRPRDNHRPPAPAPATPPPSVPRPGKVRSPLQHASTAPAGRSAPAGPYQGRVSLCMIVKNEEENLPACLASVEGVFSEVIVLDTGSTDRTKEVAAGLGAKVFDFPWVDSFATARNESLRHARGDWVFWLDADDRLDDATRPKLITLLTSLKDENAAYTLKCRCTPDATGTATVVDHVRLFRNRPDIYWEFRVHEQILPSLRRSGAEVRWAGVEVLHTGYADRAVRRRKLERDLRLLHLEQAEQPGHAFTLFNLGSVYRELGRPAEALPYLRQSVEGSHPRDSIIRKLYSLIAGCHEELGQPEQALAAATEGLNYCSDDAELLYLRAAHLLRKGQLAEAETAAVALLTSRPADHFASVVEGLRGFKARHLLGQILLRQGRPHEAEAHWRQAAREADAYLPARLSLANLLLEQQRWSDLEAVAAEMEGNPGWAGEAIVLRARAHLARKEFDDARRLLAPLIESRPQWPAPRRYLSYAFLQEGNDLDAAERALRELLEVDPGDDEAKHNLGVLLRNRAQRQDAAFMGPVALQQLYDAACKQASEVSGCLPAIYALARDCGHVTQVGACVEVLTALLCAEPAVLTCYDSVKPPEFDRFQGLATATNCSLHEQDTLWLEIEETDLLVIDALYVFECLGDLLALHGKRARKFIVLHGVVPHATGEREQAPNSASAMEAFLMRGEFRLQTRSGDESGLVVLERLPKGDSVGN